MGRAYGKVLVTVWTDEDFLALSMPARLLYLALVTQPDVTGAGVLAVTEGRWARYLSADSSRSDVSSALDELDAARFVLVDRDHDELWVRSMMRHDGRLDNANLRSSVISSFESIRSPRLHAAAVAEYERIVAGRTPSEGRRDAVPDAVPDPVPTPSPMPSRRRPGLLQPSAGSQKPETPAAAATTPKSSGARLSAAAAAAVDVLIEHRIATEAVRSPARYAETLRASIPRDTPSLAQVPDDADAVEVAVNVLGLTFDQAVRADVARRRKLQQEEP